MLEGYPSVPLPESFTCSRLGAILRFVQSVALDADFAMATSTQRLLPGYFYFSAWIAIIAAKFYGVPIIFATDAHNLRTWVTPGTMENSFEEVYRPPHLWTRPGRPWRIFQGAVQYLMSLGLPKEEIVLGGNVVDNEWWTEQAAKVDRDAVRRSWQIPTDAAVILLCAKLQPWKRPMDLSRRLAGPMYRIPISCLRETVVCGAVLSNVQPRWAFRIGSECWAL